MEINKKLKNRKNNHNRKFFQKNENTYLIFSWKVSHNRGQENRKSKNGINCKLQFKKICKFNLYI